ncbi:hypothetical protein MRX96_003002 [Rhipicephalus microplus]
MAITVELSSTTPHYVAAETRSLISTGAAVPFSLTTDDPISTSLPASTDEVAMDVAEAQHEVPATQRPRNTSVVVPRLHPSPPPAEDEYEMAVQKAAQRQARTLQAAAIATYLAVAGTVLYRPSTPGGSFTGSPHLTLAAELAKRLGRTAVCVNLHRNIAAADAVSPACLSKLLTMKELSGFRVTAREPADCRSSVGFLYGVDGTFTGSELTTELELTVPVLAASKEGHTGPPCREPHQGSRPAAPHFSATPFNPAAGEPIHYKPTPSSLDEPAEDSRDTLIAYLLAALRVVRDGLPLEQPVRAVRLAALNGLSFTILLN